MSEYPEDGRTVGSVIMLQALLGEILRTHPEKDAILQTGLELHASLERVASETVSSGDYEKFSFHTQIASGAGETLNVLLEATAG